jgi:ATP-binding cassette, subfamily B, multidrug efflux pump
VRTARGHLGWIGEYWYAYRAVLVPLGLLTIANAAVLVVYPLLLGRIIDGVQQAGSVDELLRNTLFLVLFGVTHFFIYASMQYLRARQNLRFQFSVRVRLFEHLLKLGRSFFARFRTGDLVTRLNDDVNEKLSWYMCSGIARVVEALLLIVFGVAAMLWINPLLTLYAAGPLPILIGVFVVTATRLHRRYERVQRTISELNDSLESCFSGIRVIKAFAAEPAQRMLVENAIDAQRDAEIRAVRLQTVIDSMYGKLWQLAVVGVLLSGGLMVMEGNITLGELIAFNSYVLMLVWPMFDVGQFLVRGRLSAVSIDRLRQLEEFDPEIPLSVPIRRPDKGPPTPPVSFQPAGEALPVEFVEVAYCYPDSTEPALRGISFRAEPGALTAIAGEVGAGKSTLIQLVPRLIEPTAGEIRVGDRSLAEWDLEMVRRMIGFVPQEAVLLSGTVEENIRFGRDWIDDAELGRAIEIAHLSEDLEIWPDGLRTTVGSRGVRLSGGQKQRVALARALAGRPSILLLDDTTSGLDARTEEEVWKNLPRAMPNCATLLVTHRPATLKRANQIILLDHGEIREKGTFAELNRPGSLFHNLYLKWALEENWEGSQSTDP